MQFVNLKYIRKQLHTQDDQETDPKISELAQKQITAQTTSARPLKTNSDGKQHATQICYRVMTNVCCYEISGQLTAPPDTPDREAMVCFMHDTCHINTHQHTRVKYIKEYGQDCNSQR